VCGSRRVDQDELGVGESVGDGVGEAVGDGVGEAVGDGVGASVGDGVGEAVGDGVGAPVGVAVGVEPGVGLGWGPAVPDPPSAGSEALPAAEPGRVPPWPGRSSGAVGSIDGEGAGAPEFKASTASLPPGSSIDGASVGSGCWEATVPPLKVTARAPTMAARAITATSERRATLAAPRRTRPLPGGRRPRSAMDGGPGEATGAPRIVRTDGRSSVPPPTRWNGRQTRQPPSTWFQQFEQHELEHSGQVRNSSAPADPSRSRSRPHRSQNVVASSTGSDPRLCRPGTCRAVIGR
jgi:hypothetical protein